MKKEYSIIIFLLCSLSAFAQQQCPQIVFSYDASGNRIQRKLVVTDCNSQRPNSPATPPAPTFNANAYPNPAQDKLTIEMEQDSTENTAKIVLYDLVGKEIYSSSTQLLRNEIDVSLLSSGSYILKITRGKKMKTFNVVKN